MDSEITDNENNGAYRIAKAGNKAVLSIHLPPVISRAPLFNNLTINFAYLEDVSDLEIDMKEVSEFDSYLIVFLLALRGRCYSMSVELKIVNANLKLQAFLDKFLKEPKRQEYSVRGNIFADYIEKIGTTAIMLTADIREFTEFLGNMTLKALNLIIHPTQMRWKDFPNQFLQSGVNAVPITTLIVFLIGLITGYQGALQLGQFGADIYIADFIGIAITRELAPLMTAILVAGRSGSAFAAEIGTMKVSEEIDALNTMGFDTMQFLVLPRVLSVVAAMPLLVIITDIAGVFGGMISAITTLDITVAGYLNELQRAVSYAHLFSGLGKSMIFGYLIATIGCFRGLQVKGGAESVGKFTTISVVSGVLAIIVADAVFTFIFQAIGI